MSTSEFEDGHTRHTNGAERAIPRPGIESSSKRDPRVGGFHDDAGRDVTVAVKQRRLVLALSTCDQPLIHVRNSFTSRPCSRSATRVFRWCSAAWQRSKTPVPGGSKMLTLAMRREHEDSKNNNNSDGYTRQRSRDNNNATGGDEFVDILQVQQLLLDSGVPANGNGRGGRVGRGRDHQPAAIDGRGRLLDAFSTQPYYYGSYGQHAPATAASVDDLVALWFAGPSASGVFYSFYFFALITIHIHVHFYTCVKEYRKNSV